MGRKRKSTDYSKYGAAISDAPRQPTRAQINQIAGLSTTDAESFRVLMARRPRTQENVRDALDMIRTGNLELELYFLSPVRREYPTPQSALNNAI